jgi:NAD(P)-dependent dehydrogenase (short-subunit alcohol dehydrogenase family)
MKNIVITGANQGIGYYMAERLLADGNAVAVLDLNIENLQELKSKYKDRLLSCICDMEDTEAVTNTIDKIAASFGSIDIAVHNACYCTFDSMEATGEDIYKKVFNVNYFGALRLTKALIPYMKKQKNGRIIFTSSGVGVTGFFKISPYASSKGAIESLAKCLSIEYQYYGITFHIIHPPLTRTKSAEPLPIPKEFKADPKTVGYGIARHLQSKGFVICHSFGQKIQTKLCYLFPLAFGRLMSKMTARSEEAGNTEAK